MQTTLQYYHEQQRYHRGYCNDVKELTNRQLLKEERQERERITDVTDFKAQGHDLYLGDDIRYVLLWATKNHTVTVAEILRRGYVWKGNKYVNVKTKTI